MGGRTCIVCGSEGPFEFVHKQVGYDYTMVRCPHCGLVFQDPQPSDEVLNASYYQDPAFSRQLLGPLREITLKRAREKLVLLQNLDLVGNGGRALDVGCS